MAWRPTLSHTFTERSHQLQVSDVHGQCMRVSSGVKLCVFIYMGVLDERSENDDAYEVLKWEYGLLGNYLPILKFRVSNFCL